LAKDGGEEGRKKIASITRYTTVLIALLQGFGYYTLIRSYGLIDAGTLPAIWVGIVIVLSFTAGSAFLMWLGEQITEFGVGNGISVILFAGIVSRVPRMVSDCISGLSIWSGVKNGTITEDSLVSAGLTTAQAQAQLKLAIPPWMIPVMLIGMLALVVFIVFISNAERRIPVQYAKRVVGRKMYGGQSTHIPMKVNMSGVMPIIFAQSIASLPATIGAFAGWTTDNSVMMRLFDTSKPFYSIIYFFLIVGFSYFYASMTFNPVEVANNLKKNGGFIPGFRPGKPTADFITKVLNKITMFGALYLSVVAIAPIITGNIVGYSSLAIGGTSVIIVVGVALETVKQIEAQMLMRHYKGFLE
jgi:preprotein translocase subunit SecY